MNPKPNPMNIADLRRLNPRLDSSKDLLKEPPRKPPVSIETIRAGLGVTSTTPPAAPAPAPEKKPPAKKG